MKQLTFKGFLMIYLKRLSNASTISLKKLAETAVKDNERVAEPLLIYSYLYVPKNTARRQLINTDLFDKFDDLCKSYLTEDSFINYISSANDDFGKVYQSYLVIRNRSITTKEVKQKAIAKIIQLQNDKNMSINYICKELNINYSNYKRFLSGNTDMLSLRNIWRVLNFLGMKKEIIKDDNWLNQ